jgi:hypothetical protein
MASYEFKVLLMTEFQINHYDEDQEHTFGVATLKPIFSFSANFRTAVCHM